MNQFKHGADLRIIKEKYDVDEILDFSSNVNIFHLTKVDEILKNIDVSDLSLYPDIEYKELREKIGKKYKKNLDNIIVGNGSTEIIFLITKLDFIKNIGIIVPTFGEYKRACYINKKEVELFYYDKNFCINIDDIDFKNLDLIFVCNPNNPSGNTNDLSLLLEKSRENNVILFVDETFMDFTDEKNSLLGKTSEYDNLFVLKAVTKFYSLTGIRLGYGFGNEDLISKMWEIKEPWTINYFSEKLFDAVFDVEFEIKTKKFFENEIKWFKSQLSEIKDIEYFDTESNYILIKLLNHKSDVIKEQLIIDNKILIRDCSNYDGLDDSFIRVNIKDREKNIKLIKALKEILCLKK